MKNLRLLRYSVPVFACLLAGAVAGANLAAEECRSPEFLRLIPDSRPEV